MLQLLALHLLNACKQSPLQLFIAICGIRDALQRLHDNPEDSTGVYLLAFCTTFFSLNLVLQPQAAAARAVHPRQL